MRRLLAAALLVLVAAGPAAETWIGAPGSRPAGHDGLDTRFAHAPRMSFVPVRDCTFTTNPPIRPAVAPAALLVPSPVRPSSGLVPTLEHWLWRI